MKITLLIDVLYYSELSFPAWSLHDLIWQLALIMGGL